MSALNGITVNSRLTSVVLTRSPVSSGAGVLGGQRRASPTSATAASRRSSGLGVMSSQVVQLGDGCLLADCLSGAGGGCTGVPILAGRRDGLIRITLVVPIGGGGLNSGTVLEAARHGNRIRVIGVETKSSMAVSAAVRAGHTVHVDISDTIADGLAGGIEDGCITPDIIRDAGVELLSVSERAIRSAVCELASQAGVVVEGSSAVALAAVAEGLMPMDRTTVLVLTGRNIAMSLLNEVIT